MSVDDEVRAFVTDPVLQKRLAKYLVLQCFRNSALEDLHAGVCPDSVVGDCSDVRVSSPYGDIPWPKVSRLNDDEMKCLMIDVVNRIYRFTIGFSMRTLAANYYSGSPNATRSRDGTNPHFWMKPRQGGFPINDWAAPRVSYPA
jgi:hypothetical protein